jgi:tight adherence protein B
VIPRLENISELIPRGAIFLLVVLVWAGAVWIWALRRASRASTLERRLGSTDLDEESARVLRLWYGGREVTTAVPGRGQRLSLRDRLDRLRREAGWQAPLRSVLLGVLGLVALGFLAGFVFTGGVLAGVGLGLVILLGFWTYAKNCATRHAAAFERQLVDAMGLAARSLRAGHPLSGAFRLIAEEIPAPVGAVFADICQKQVLGVGLAAALREATATTISTDMRLFATSVIIQSRTGGNLADMTERLAAVIRDRMRLNRRARVAMAQTQFSKRVLLIMPFAMFVLLNLVNPRYMEPFYESSLGQYMLFGAGASLLVGLWVMNRLAVLRY